MALPNPLFIAFQGLQTYFSDATTATALGGGSVQFFRDVNRTETKDVYQQVRLPNNTYDFVNIGSIVTLNAAGAFQSPTDGTDIQVYAYPYVNDPFQPNPGDIDLYYLQVYDVNGVYQFDREAQPANAVFQEDTNENFVATANEITNPQFVTVLFPTPSSTFSVTGTNTSTVIAPNWNLITTGSGTVTLTQTPITTAPIDGNPPYVLAISSSGLSGNVLLQQQITASPRLLLNSYVSGSFLASGANIPFRMDYIPSKSTAQSFTICTGTGAPDGSYNTISNTVSTNTSNINTDAAPDGYITISISFPANSSVSISNVQIVAVESDASSAPFIELSTPMQINGLFNYYYPQLAFKPIKSYLVGWDFALNPAQFNGWNVGVQNTGANGSYYLWDQTILFQSANNAVTSQLGINDSLLLTAQSNTKIALIQYLTDYDILNFALNNLSVNVRTSTTQTGLPMTISLWYSANTSLPNPPISTNFESFVNTLDSNGHPNSVQSGWVEIENIYRYGTFSNDSNTAVDYGFPGWPGSTIPVTGGGAAKWFAIVVGTGTLNATERLRFNSISLVPGDVPTIPAPQTLDEVLRECQNYWEMSYAPYNTSTPIGTVSKNNALTYYTPFFGSASPYSVVNSSFQINFKQTKRAQPSLTFYSPKTGTSGKIAWYSAVDAGLDSGTDVTASTYWANFGGGTQADSYYPTFGSGYMGTLISLSSHIQTLISFHYTANARLGDLTPNG